MTNKIRVVHANRVYEVLGSVRDKPNLWLTARSVTALQNFLNGYLLTTGTGSLDVGVPTFVDFGPWPQNELDWWHGGHQHLFGRILLEQCGGDETRAFDLFFTYLDEYRKEPLATDVK